MSKIDDFSGGTQLNESTVFPRFSAPPSDKRPLQITLDFDQKDR